MDTSCQTCLPSSKVLTADLPLIKRQFLIEQKALSYRVREGRPTINLETKGVRAVWDPNIGPGGGWRCPEGTRYGGRITDRFGRLCGGGIIRRVGRALLEAGQRLDDVGERRDLRRLDRAAERAERGAGRVRQQAERLALAQERAARALVGDWQPGDGGRRSRRNLPGGPAQRVSMVQRAPRRRRVVKPEARRAQRTQGTTPKRPPLRERIALAQERAARRVLGEQPIQERQRRTPSMPSAEQVVPSVPTTQPTPEVVPDAPTTAPSSSRSSRRIQSRMTPGQFANVISSGLSRTDTRKDLRDSALTQAQYDRGKNQVITEGYDLAAEWQRRLSMSYLPTPEDVFERVDWSKATSDEKRDYLAFYIASQPGLYDNLLSHPVWNNEQIARIRMAAKRQSRRAHRTPSNPFGSSAQDFWERRRNRLANRKLSSISKPLTRDEFEDYVLNASESYIFGVSNMDNEDLEILRGLLAEQIDELKNNENPPMWAKALIGKKIGLLRAVDDELEKRKAPVKIEEDFLNEMSNLIKNLPLIENIGPRVIPALQVENQRKRLGLPLAPEDYPPGELPLPNRILNDKIKSEEDAVKALDAGVPLELIPQQYWLAALYQHMDENRNNKKQYTRKAKNGGICKDGSNGDLLILVKKNPDGTDSDTGIVIGWEARQGGMNRNGLVNNVGEVIGWNLMNALGLNVEPARFDGLVTKDARGRRVDAAVAFAIPFAWNRAPVGTPIQRANSDSYMPANFDPTVVDSLPDRGFPQRLAHNLFVALIGVEDRHNQNVMGGRFGGRLDGQAYVVPIDLGWGGKEIWDGQRITNWIEGEIDGEYGFFGNISEHLSELKKSNPDEAQRQALALAQVLDTVIERGNEVVKAGIVKFRNRIMESMHLDDYDDLDEDDRELLLDTAEYVASNWFRAFEHNLSKLVGERETILKDYFGIDADIGYEVPDSPGLNPISQASIDVADVTPEPDDLTSSLEPVARAFRRMFPSKIFVTDRDAVVRDAARRALSEKESHYVYKLDGVDSFVVLNDEENKRLWANTLLRYRMQVIDWVAPKNVKLNEIDPRDFSAMTDYLSLHASPEDMNNFFETYAYLAGDTGWDTNLKKAQEIIEGGPDDEAGIILDKLERLVDLIWDNVSSNQPGVIDGRLIGNIARLGVYNGAIDLLRARGITPSSRGQGSSPSPQRSILRQPLQALRPRVRKSNPIASLGNQRPTSLDPDAVFIPPQPIINDSITTTAQAIEAFNNGADLMTIPEVYWPDVMMAQMPGFAESDPEVLQFIEVAQNGGAIKNVQIMMRAKFDSDGIPIPSSADGYVIVQDRNLQSLFGELLGWHLMQALGLPVDVARMYDDDDNNLFVAIPHALNRGPGGNPLFYDAYASPRPQGTWGTERPDRKNFQSNVFQQAQDRGLPGRIAAVLSQYLAQVPDRHYDNAVAAAFSRGIEEETAAIPIDLGWVGDGQNNLFDMVTDEIFFDRYIFEDAKEFFQDAKVSREYREMVAKRMIEVVDEMISRQRRLLARGHDDFIRDAMRLLPNVQDSDVARALRLAAEFKAARVYKALQKTLDEMEQGDYDRLWRWLGVTTLLGQKPEMKSAQVSSYWSRTKVGSKNG